LRILITGAFGYLGGRISSFYSSIPEYEITLASSRVVKIPNPSRNLKVIRINWNDKQSIHNACKNIDVIIHTLGMNAQDCILNPEEALKVNGIFSEKLVESAILNNVKKVIYFSTAHVYDNPLKGILTEAIIPKNNHPYSTSNLAGEKAIIQAHSSGKVQGIVLRLSNCIGAPTSKNTNCWMLLVNDLCKQIIENHKMKINSNYHQLRNFISINDVCGIVKLFTELNFRRNENTIFNVGNKTISIINMAEIIQKRCRVILGFLPELETNGQNSTQVENFEYKIDKLKSIGFNTFTSYEREIDDLLIFCKNNFQFEQ